MAVASALDSVATVAFLSRPRKVGVALLRGEEAVATYRRLAADAPSFEPKLARALHTLASTLGGAGRHDAAIATGEEAAEHYRRLAAGDPALVDRLAWALRSLARAYRDAGRPADARAADEEAVATHRRLTERDERYLNDFAAFLIGSIEPCGRKGSTVTPFGPPRTPSGRSAPWCHPARAPGHDHPATSWSSPRATWPAC